jgi:hypothetical protein
MSDMALRHRYVRSGEAAIKVARRVADDAGLVFYDVTSAKKTKGGKWIVYIDSFAIRYRAVIDSANGEVIEWKKLK